MERVINEEEASVMERVDALRMSKALIDPPGLAWHISTHLSLWSGELPHQSRHEAAHLAHALTSEEYVTYAAQLLTTQLDQYNCSPAQYNTACSTLADLGYYTLPGSPRLLTPTLDIAMAIFVLCRRREDSIDDTPQLPLVQHANTEAIFGPMAVGIWRWPTRCLIHAWQHWRQDMPEDEPGALSAHVMQTLARHEEEIQTRLADAILRVEDMPEADAQALLDMFDSRFQRDLHNKPKPISEGELPGMYFRYGKLNLSFDREIVDVHNPQSKIGTPVFPPEYRVLHHDHLTLLVFFFERWLMPRWRAYAGRSISSDDRHKEVYGVAAMRVLWRAAQDFLFLSPEGVKEREALTRAFARQVQYSRIAPGKPLISAKRWLFYNEAFPELILALLHAGKAKTAAQFCERLCHDLDGAAHTLTHSLARAEWMLWLYAPQKERTDDRKMRIQKLSSDTLMDGAEHLLSEGTKGSKLKGFLAVMSDIMLTQAAQQRLVALTTHYKGKDAAALLALCPDVKSKMS